MTNQAECDTLAAMATHATRKLARKSRRDRREAELYTRLRKAILSTQAAERKADNRAAWGQVPWSALANGNGIMTPCRIV